jgi:uncharacterized protein YbjT (DUF2867 family)
MYVVTGATGNIGSKVVELLNPGENPVRAIARSRERLQPLIDLGAEPWICDLEDTPTLTEAFKDAVCVYTIIPPNPGATNFRQYQNDIGESIATAIRTSGVQYVVNLSSVGAHLPEGMGVVNGLHDQEERLNRLEGVNVLHLRPSFFMENLYWMIPLIKESGIIGSPQLPDLHVPMIATRDIAAVTADAMLKRNFSGKTTQELLGERDVSMQEAVTVLGQAIGKTDLNYVQFPYEDIKQSMIQMGMSEDVAGGMVELYRAFNEGTAKPTESRSARNTTPTRFEDWADDFAAAYRMS